MKFKVLLSALVLLTTNVCVLASDLIDAVTILLTNATSKPLSGQKRTSHLREISP